MIGKHIDPRIGSVRLRDLGRHQVQQFRAGMLRDGCSPQTVNSTMRILSAALGRAEADGLIPANPCLRLGAVKVTAPQDRRPLPIPDVEAIREHVPTAHDRAVVSLLAYLGLRPGELAALRWEDVTDTRVHVHRALSAGIITTPKTSAGKRVIPMPGFLRDEVAALHALVAARNPHHQDQALVFAGPRGGFWNPHNWTTRVWRPAIANAFPDRFRPVVKETRRGRPTRVVQVPVPGAHIPMLYELRHAAASLWIAEGHNALQVAVWMGHSKPSLVQDRYAHLFADAGISGAQDTAAAVAAARLVRDEQPAQGAPHPVV